MMPLFQSVVIGDTETLKDISAFQDAKFLSYLLTAMKKKMIIEMNVNPF